MAIWKTYRIADVVTDIGDEKFVLPVIQRSLVWTEEKMELLFDTLLKGDSFGGVMVIEEEKDSKPLFNYRPFTRDGNFIVSRQVDKLSQQQLFVIDGQQRLQSFYIGLKGSIGGKVLYFDLFSDFNSDFEFKFENDATKLPIKSKDERPILEHFWYPVSGLLEKLKNTGKYKQTVKEIVDKNNIIDDTKKDYIEENILAFYENVLNSDTLGISKVVINKSLPEIENRQRIVELFRRLNDGGTRLSPFDLVASILKGFSWEMEGFLKEMLETYQDIGLSQDNLIKLIFLLQDNPYKEMVSIEVSDADFAIQKKDRIKATIKALKDYLEYSKIYEYYKNTNFSFIPLFFIAYHLFHKPIDNNKLEHYFDNYDSGNVDFPLMKRWLYHSLLNGVFRSRGAGWIPYKTGIRKILETIKHYKSKDFPINELFQVYKNHLNTFTTTYASDNLSQLDNPFVFFLMYDRTRTTRTNDIDHIMPKSILEDKGYEGSKINSIKNYQLIDYGTNRGTKNGKPFALWINYSEYVKDKSAFVKLHLIPENENLWIEDNFLEFEEERAKLIINKLETYTK
ncbi:hypothetical protein EZS27_011281 [termite gut metagenome]|uniref:GmrSD restriction endonucleases N-terminal domain-containing protein n=1 Tax=termite gut metagenome TaxID=433724 RepID=A0A5J4S697_9ZZZZ